MMTHSVVVVTDWLDDDSNLRIPDTEWGRSLYTALRELTKGRETIEELPPCEGRCGLPGGCQHSSDCSQHNESAFEQGPCDCRPRNQDVRA